jgi:DNA-directed RNA polymerase subunit alpha
MIPLPLEPKETQKGKNKAIFEIEGLYPGYGVTMGNALRRVLLTSLEGVAVTEAKIKGVPHEFSTIPGVLEDAIMIILNLKNLRFKIHEGQTQKVELLVKGEKEVTGADFKLSPQIELANPELHIATLTDKKTEFHVELTLEKGVGYEPKENRKIKKPEIGSMVLDAIFTPIKNVSFAVETMRVGERIDFDRLTVEIETDGTLTPQEAFHQAVEILLAHVTILSQGGAAKKGKPEATEVTEANIMEDVTKMLVEELKLSTRTLNALQENSIKTVGGIMKKSEKTLSEMEGMGEKAMTEIKKKLKKIGLELKEGE